MAMQVNIAGLEVTNAQLFQAIQEVRREVHAVQEKTSRNAQDTQETKNILLEVTNSRINSLEESFRRLEGRSNPIYGNGTPPRTVDHQFSIPDEGTQLFCLKPIKHQDVLKACGAKEKLGEGGFGIVYRGKWNGQDIAVKVLTQDTAKGRVFSS